MGTNKRNKNANASRAKNRVKKDSFFTVHFKQARLSLAEFWQRPLGNILTLAVISMALAMPSALYLLGKNISAASTNVTNPSEVRA